MLQRGQTEPGHWLSRYRVRDEPMRSRRGGHTLQVTRALNADRFETAVLLSTCSLQRGSASMTFLVSHRVIKLPEIAWEVRRVSSCWAALHCARVVHWGLVACQHDHDRSVQHLVTEQRVALRVPLQRKVSAELRAGVSAPGRESTQRRPFQRCAPPRCL